MDYCPEIFCRFRKCKPKVPHTIYTRNNMGQKCEGDCGLWVLDEIIKKTYPENLKKKCGCRLEITC